MTKLFKRIGVGILSLSMILTSLAWPMTLVASADDEATYTDLLTVRTVDEDGNPVVGVNVYWDQEFDTTPTNSYGYYVHKVGFTNGTVNVGVNDDNYTCDTVLAVKCVNNWADPTYIESINGSPYDGSAIELVVKAKSGGGDVTPAPIEYSNLKLRAVDETGAAVEGLQFKLVNDSAEYPPSLGLTDENGEVTHLCSWDDPADYKLELNANDDYEYDGNDTITIAENSSRSCYVKSINGVAYDGEFFVVTVKEKESEPAPAKTDTLKVMAVDNEGAPVANVSFYYGQGSSKTPFTAGEDGVATVTLGSWLDGIVNVGVEDANYTSETVLKVNNVIDWGTMTSHIATVDGVDYTGDVIKITVTPSEGGVVPAAKPSELKFKVVDENGDAVEGIAFKLVPEGIGRDTVVMTASNESGDVVFDCGNMSEDYYNFELVTNDGYTYEGTNRIQIEYDTNNFKSVIEKVNNADYDGTPFNVTVKKTEDKPVLNPVIDAVTVSKNTVSADGETVTVTVTGKDLPETLYMKKYYCEYNYGSSMDMRDDWNTYEVQADGTATERTFNVTLSAASSQPTAYAWKIGVTLDTTWGAPETKTGEIAIEGIEKPEPTKVTSVLVNKKEIGPEGGKVTVTVNGTGIPSKLFCKLIPDDRTLTVFDEEVDVIGETSRSKTFELAIPASADYKDTKTWKVAIRTSFYGTSVESDEISVVELEPVVLDDRISGTSRYDTALAAAEAFKQANRAEKFDAIIIANGENYPDALAGGYLAKVKNAPIILVSKSNEAMIRSYVEKNLAENGKVYLLGGTGAVSAGFENALKASYGSDVVRLGGQTRYDTNIAILKEAGVSNEELLVCTGTNYADSLSASSAGRPILLVGTSLTAAQKEFLKGLTSSKITAIGGTGVVSNTIMNAIAGTFANKPEVTRVAGKTRYETSVAVAKAFFGDKLDSVMLAVATNFPDGLSGGSLASLIGAPIILVTNSNYAEAKAYCNEVGITKSIALGGSAVISDTVREAMIAIAE